MSSNLSKQRSPTAEIIGIYFIGIIVPIKYMPIISAVGLFYFDDFEDNQTRKCSTFFSECLKPFSFGCLQIYQSKGAQQQKL